MVAESTPGPAPEPEVAEAPEELAAGATWIWNSQAPPPSSGQVRTDSRDWLGAKLLHVDRRLDDGSDVSATLAQVLAGDTVRLEHQTDPTRFARYTVQGNPTRVADAYQYPVSYLDGGGTLPNSGTRIVVTNTPGPGPGYGNEIIVRFTLANSGTTWIGEASCKHGTVRNPTYAIQAGAPPLNPTALVNAVRRQHAILVGCGGPYELPYEIANVTFGPAAGVQPGQQRIIAQNSAVVRGTRVFFGPPLTVLEYGSYVINASMTLAAAAPAGIARVLVGGATYLSAPLVTQNGQATASMGGMLNLRPNESIVVAFENTSATVHDVQATTLTVGEVWVPK